MVESFGSRPLAPSGPAASLPAMQAGEKIVHRPEKKVLPAERVERTAQTGPRPAFRHTYLEQLAAFWPKEPDPPVTRVDYDGAEGAAPQAEAASDGTTEDDRAATTTSPAPEPRVDIRR